MVAVVALLMHSLTLATFAPATAAPSSDTAAASAIPAQNVDWMSPETASSLDIDIPVLLPTAVPSPFSESPAVSVSGGYYSLYWVVYGGEPTYLHITGTAGGSLPAGSPYDLNIELSINETVQGYDAIHDVTPIYDSVWWIADGVLYQINSQNMSGGSLALANELIALQPPAADPPAEPEPPAEPAPTEPPAEGEPEPTAPVPSDPPLGSDPPPGSEPPPGNDVVEIAPDDTAPVDQAAEQEPVDPAGEEAADVDADEAIDIDADEAIDATEDDELGETTADAPDDAPSTTGGSGRVPTDGTDGPPRPVYGDGTGGPVYNGRLPQD